MSLLQIAKVPTAENSAIHLNSADNIAVARVPLAPGNEVRVDGSAVTIQDAVPAGHKVALSRIPAGENIVRYGQVIGRARIAIEPGQHVHTQNVEFGEITFDYEFPVGERAIESTSKSVPTFLGYAREDGRAGTRNYIAVVAASNCAAYTAEQIAESFGPSELPPGVHGVVAFPHGEGCGHAIGPDTDQLRRTLAGVLDHPNVAGAVILGLGCEVNQIEHYLGTGAPSSDRLVGLTVQGSGGTRSTVEAARRAIGPMLERAAAEKRVELPASKIVLGLNCGGSDSFSGITANPALGYCSFVGRDRRVGRAGGNN